MPLYDYIQLANSLDKKGTKVALNEAKENDSEQVKFGLGMAKRLAEASEREPVKPAENKTPYIW